MNTVDEIGASDGEACMRVLAVHALAVLLVFGFVNTFALWRAFGEMFGQGARDALPWIAVLGVAAVLVVFYVRRASVTAPSLPWLAGAAVLAAIGLSITDPAFPAKRIHVPQYFLLAVVVWLALPARLRTSATPFLTLLVAAIYGVHDEFLQGFHPRRTFGLRDMLVNLCGASSGALVMLAFMGKRDPKTDPRRAGTFPPTAVIAIAAAIVGTLLMAWGATGFRNDLVAYWVSLPVLAAGFWLALMAEGLPSRGDRHAIRAIAATCSAFLLYPVLTDVTHLDFA